MSERDEPPSSPDAADSIPSQRDAIHLATASLLRADLDRPVTYDPRMSVAAAEAGLPVTAPA